MSTPSVSIPLSVASALVDVQAYAARQPVEDALAWLRANDPVARIELDDYQPFWAVTKHEDVASVSLANGRYLVEAGNPVQLVDNEMRKLFLAGDSRTLVQINAPDHMKLRAVTQSWFMPKNLRGREDRVRAAAKRSIDRLLAKGDQCDFMNDMASSYPLHIIMDILGVPEEHEAQMLAWSKQLISHQDPELRRQMDHDPGGMASHMAVLQDLMGYFMTLAYSRRANPVDDVATIIANSKIDGVQISDIDTLGYYIIIATAGHDTTSSSTGGAGWMLAQNPELLARVKSDLSLIPKLVEEAIRWTTPVQHFMRTAAEDAELRGRHISKGDWLFLSYLSGNRDEEVFERAAEFDIDRPPNKHISFGYGVHNCLGQHLAKMEMRALFEELLPRVDTMELTGPVKAVASSFVWGPKELPMRIRPS